MTSAIPRYDREALSMHDRRHLMCGFRPKGDEGSGICVYRNPLRICAVNHQRAAAVSPMKRLGRVHAEKNDHRDSAGSRVVADERSVAVLMRDEKIADAVP